MKLTPYNVNTKVYCQNNTEAMKVQNAINDLTNGTNIIGDELLNFYAMYKRNEPVIKPVLQDVIKNGISAIGKHTFKLLRLK